MEDSSSTHSSLPRCAVVRYRREGNKVHWTPCGPPASPVAARVRNFEDAFELEEFSSRALNSNRSYPIVLPSGGDIPLAVARPNRFGWLNWKKSTRKQSNFAHSSSDRNWKEDLGTGPRKMRTAPYSRRQRSYGFPWSREPSALSSKSSFFGGVESERSGYMRYNYDNRYTEDDRPPPPELRTVETGFYRKFQSLKRRLGKLAGRNKREFDFEDRRFQDDNRYHFWNVDAY